MYHMRDFISFTLDVAIMDIYPRLSYSTHSSLELDVQGGTI